MHAPTGHKEARGKEICLPLDRLLRPAGAADQGRLGRAVEQGTLVGILRDIGPMEPPVSDFVRNAETITARHRRVLLRIETVIDQDGFSIDPNGSENVRLVAEHWNPQ